MRGKFVVEKAGDHKLMKQLAAIHMHFALMLSASYAAGTFSGGRICDDETAANKTGEFVVAN